MSKVILKGFIQIPKLELDVVKEQLELHIQLTREESGCLVFEVVQDGLDGCLFQVYEEFDSEESFSFHQERVKNSVWGEVSCNVNREYEIEYIKDQLLAAEKSVRQEGWVTQSKDGMLKEFKEAYSSE